MARIRELQAELGADAGTVPDETPANAGQGGHMLFCS